MLLAESALFGLLDLKDFERWLGLFRAFLACIAVEALVDPHTAAIFEI